MILGQEWSLAGAEGESILGVTDAAAGARLSVALLHGHKGYYDYGFLPVLARRLAEALPVAVHRFNASHSGMTRTVETFERPDLFALDTWNKQVFDLRAVARAARGGTLPGSEPGGPVIVAGHSRGGVACLLSAGREGEAGEKPDAVVSMSAPSWCASDVEVKQRELVETGRLSTPSGRTGQDLYAAPIWLGEQLERPDAHDVLALCRRIEIPSLIVHGEEDETIPLRCAEALAEAIPGAEIVRVPGANHTFNTPNPASLEDDPSPPLERVLEAVAGFVERRL